jgi:hypothetical protein
MHYEKYLDLRTMNSMSDMGYYMRKCGIHTGYQVLVIVRLVISRELKRVDHMAQMGQTGITCRILVGHLLENMYLEDGEDGWITPR